MHVPNLDKPEPKRVFTADVVWAGSAHNAENAEKNKEEKLCALCVPGRWAFGYSLR